MGGSFFFGDSEECFMVFLFPTNCRENFAIFLMKDQALAPPYIQYPSYLLTDFVNARQTSIIIE